MRFTNPFKILVILCAMSAVYSAAAAEMTPSEPDLELQRLIREANESYASLSGYHGQYYREELHENGKWVIEENFIKFEKPFTILLGQTKGPFRGRQILYSEGNFNDQIIVKPPGVLFSMIPLVSLPEDDPRIAKGETHSIKRAGIGSFLERFGRRVEESRMQGLLEILSIEDVSVGGETGKRVDVVFSLPDYPYKRMAVTFSSESKLPIESKLYRSRTQVSEMHRYLRLSLDAAGETESLREHVDKRMYDKFREIHSSVS